MSLLLPSLPCRGLQFLEFRLGFAHVGHERFVCMQARVGEKEVADGVVSVRKRKDGDKGSMKVADFLKMTEEDRKVVR